MLGTNSLKEAAGPVIPATLEGEGEGSQFEVSLGDLSRPCLRRKSKKRAGCSSLAERVQDPSFQLQHRDENITNSQAHHDGVRLAHFYVDLATSGTSVAQVPPNMRVGQGEGRSWPWMGKASYASCSVLVGPRGRAGSDGEAEAPPAEPGTWGNKGTLLRPPCETLRSALGG